MSIKGDEAYMRVIVRDTLGKSIAASCKEINFKDDASVAKTYALRDGLSLEQYLGCNKFVIQSDKNKSRIYELRNKPFTCAKTSRNGGRK